MLMVYFIMLLSGMYIFSSKRKHLLLTLLSLEFMVLAIFMSIFIMLSSFHFFFSLLYLVFAACEGALGLSILISMSRSYGGDYFSVFNFG
uniref:NADH-ubiquinone oxidoreductase chain 4L n=1 Tax=Dicyrtomina saundersi TaxID=438492 RepID=A0A516EZT9_9HEXA|nr:NADH dehydrogenase subunit 4L [Dicyrtomina saundersi]QDO72018.1 NADH dehydrogenase subunit 4L [Dicyrtomina saundersi]